jgi:Fe-S-cluster containining protein
MTDRPYRLEPSSGYDEYKVTSLLKDHLAALMEDPENQETIDQILKLLKGYKDQLRNLRAQHTIATIKEVYKAIDNFFTNAPEENKKGIQCKTGCTACCFIDVDISFDEVDTIINYCRENAIEIDKEYLKKQAAVGRKKYSEVSRCVFLKDNMCSIYPVRPIACRKHWVKTDPSLCDFSRNVSHPVGNYFDINTEILASAVLNVGGTGSFENMMLSELERRDNK